MTEAQPPHNFVYRDLVVIGASAGGVETLKRVVALLPADLPATICIVLHIAPDAPSLLPHILARASPMPARAAFDGDPLRNGEILVAPPDQDRGRLLDRMADQSESRGMTRSMRSFRHRAHAAVEQARTVREALASAAALTLSKADAAEVDALAGDDGSG